MRSKNNLKRASFFLRNKTRNGRVVIPTDKPLDNVCPLRDLKESVNEHTYPLVSTVIDTNNWPKTMECLEKYLMGNIGVKGVMLSYVVRPKEAVASRSDEPETSFLSSEDEMVVHAPILEGGMMTVTFKTDRMKFWGLISAITRDLDCWNYVKSSQRTRYGRKA